jgi:hypothetical protein
MSVDAEPARLRARHWASDRGMFFGMAARKHVFISATSADLGSYRQVVKDALLTLGAHPIEERNFPTD